MALLLQNIFQVLLTTTKIIYVESLDLITNCIESRFEQPGYKVYSQLEELLIKSAKGSDYQSEYEFVLRFYGSDFSSALGVQLQTFTSLFEGEEKSNLTIADILIRAKKFSTAEKELLSEVCKLIHLILVMPAITQLVKDHLVLLDVSKLI